MRDKRVAAERQPGRVALVSKRLNITVPFQVPAAEALERMRALGDYFHNRHGMTMRWESDTVAHLAGRYLVIAIEGTFRLGERAVHVDGKDPGFLVRAKATDYLERKIASYLDPATPVDQLERE